ncbi:2'-5' RNA ligase family protein [uncultured Devosia sp.]|uniref:2'-5' RNA ligase family protein n=1 Tax=uncultured Devosia sp. TaxID=211434 RepID=UPI0035CC69DB
MDGQLDFFSGGGSDRRLRAPDAPRDANTFRYYFSILPPPALAQDIERGAALLARRHGARNLIRADRLHVSLNGVWRSTDEIESVLLDDALEVGNAVRRPGFDIAFDTLLTFAGQSRSQTGGRSIVPTVLTCSNGAREVVALYADIRREMQRLGMPVGAKSTVPHLTIWYGPQRVPERLLKRPFRWPVRKFWLVRTAAGQKRPDTMGEWSLG